MLKSQIPNNIQIPKIEGDDMTVWIVVICKLGFIWNLMLGFWDFM